MSDSPEDKELTAKVFKYFDKIEKKETEIASSLPEYSFLNRLDYLSDILKDTVAEISKLLTVKEGFPKPETIQSRLPGLQRNVFFFFLLIQVIKEQFENDQMLMKPLRNREELKSILTEWCCLVTI